MIIHLPPDVESLLIAKVQSGLFPSLDAALTKAAYLLLDQIEQTQPAKSKPKPKRKQPKAAGSTARQPLTRHEFDQQLLALGLLSHIPDNDADFDDPDDELVEIRANRFRKPSSVTRR